MKNYFILALALIVLLIGSCSKNDSEPELITFGILTTADFQSTLEGMEVDFHGHNLVVGGMDRISSLAGNLRSNYDVSILLASGDDLMGSIYDMFHGEPDMRGMTMAGYDVAVPGNHEFDNGPDMYNIALNYADFDFVCSNLNILEAGLLSKIKPNVIKEYRGVRIGFFGLITPNLERITNTEGKVTVEQNLNEAARKQIAYFNENNCDLIIAITHIDAPLDLKLAAEVPGIDIIFGGQTHDSVFQVVQNDSVNCIVVQPIAIYTMGELSFMYNREIDEITDINWEIHLLDSTVGCDSTVKALMDSFLNIYDSLLSEPIGESTVDLDAQKHVIRAQETNLGNLIADSWRDWFSEIDIALVNSGCIRGDKIYPAGSISHKTVIEMQFFMDEIYEVKIDGSQLKQILEIDASAIRVDGDSCPESQRAENGGFLQVSGIKFIIDTTKSCFCAEYDGLNVSRIIDKGNRISEVYIANGTGWETLNDSTEYTILITDWSAGGGDGYYLFLESSIDKTPTTVISTDVLAKYIRDNTPISPVVEDRITIVP